jgi:N-acetylated-alpha-linked acidic dipeptidase
MRRLTALGAAVVLISTGCSSPDRAIPLGFTRGSADVQRSLEQRLIDRADPARVRDVHRELTRLPHPAGSRRDRELAGWIAQQFSDAGLEDVHISTHEVLLPRPLEVSVGASAPFVWRAQMPEGMEGAPGSSSPSRQELLPYHAFSASGEVNAPVVYAGPGAPADYEWLATHGVDVKGRIVLVHSAGPYRYRGLAAFTAQQFGAAAVLMFRLRDQDYRSSVPGMDAVARDGIERGSILYDFFYPGDPETPGWPSVPGARRLARDRLPTLPRIISVPISAVNAELILSTLGGSSAPVRWGNATSRSHVGPGAAPVRVRVRNDDAVRPVWTVTGFLRGKEEPDSVVIVGNHRDAWVFGGVDPSTGTAAMLELIRVLGTMRREGWQPRRSLLFASWDAEEFGLTSSTEWAEEHAEWLKGRAVAYLNVDSAASGSRFVAGASASLMRVVADAAGAVRDPSADVSVLSAARAHDAADRGATDDALTAVVEDRLGGGSDYTVFLNHLGVPSADLAFDGPDPMYHTLFDTHEYVERMADPGFSYTTTLARLMGVAALRLSAAEVVPIDPVAIAASVAAYLREMRGRAPAAGGEVSLRAVDAAVGDLARAAQSFETARGSALEAGDRARYLDLNRRLLQLERSFVDDSGLPGREWYRHVLMAPGRSYQPMVLPGLAEALDSGDSSRFQAQAERLAAALRRAAALLTER